jgi:hypothetical protein
MENKRHEETFLPGQLRIAALSGTGRANGQVSLLGFEQAKCR